MPVKYNKLPDIELLFELFQIDSNSPSGLRWKKTKGGRVKVGDVVGSIDTSGYWQLKLTTDKTRTYFCHRIIFYMQTGIDPLDKQVDHVHGIRENNTNLRLVTNQQNQFNRKPRKDRKGRFKGVCKKGEQWMAYICVNRKQLHLGYYRTETEAALAYNTAASEHFGEFAKLNDVRPES